MTHAWVAIRHKEPILDVLRPQPLSTQYLFSLSLRSSWNVHQDSLASRSARGVWFTKTPKPLVSLEVKGSSIPF